jgi:hypothetical protein
MSKARRFTLDWNNGEKEKEITNVITAITFTINGIPAFVWDFQDGHFQLGPAEKEQKDWRTQLHQVPHNGFLKAWLMQFKNPGGVAANDHLFYEHPYELFGHRLYDRDTALKIIDRIISEKWEKYFFSVPFLVKKSIPLNDTDALKKLLIPLYGQEWFFTNPAFHDIDEALSQYAGTDDWGWAMTPAYKERGPLDDPSLKTLVRLQESKLLRGSAITRFMNRMASDFETFKKLSITLRIPQTLEEHDMSDFLEEQLETDRASILGYLLDNSSYDINKPGNYHQKYNTLLHMAAENNSIKCARILVERSANVFSKNLYNKTPYDLIEKKTSPIAQYLKKVMDEKEAEAEAKAGAPIHAIGVPPSAQE